MKGQDTGTSASAWVEEEWITPPSAGGAPTADSDGKKGSQGGKSNVSAGAEANLWSNDYDNPYDAGRESDYYAMDDDDQYDDAGPSPGNDTPSGWTAGSFVSLGRQLFQKTEGHRSAIQKALQSGIDAIQDAPRSNLLQPLLSLGHASVAGDTQRARKEDEVVTAARLRLQEASKKGASSSSDATAHAEVHHPGPKSVSFADLQTRDHSIEGIANGHVSPMPRSRSFDNGVGGGDGRGPFDERGDDVVSVFHQNHSRYNHSRHHHWWIKAMEVLPVLAVVTLTVLGTVVYLTIVDGVLPQMRPSFSLSCNLNDGEWSASSRRPLYPSSCPYIRDDFNCRKFGLPANRLDDLRWEPRGCQVPEFSAGSFLAAMAGRRIAYVGDKSSANAFDSMICMLAQAETPRKLSLAELLQHGGADVAETPSSNRQPAGVKSASTAPSAGTGEQGNDTAVGSGTHVSSGLEVAGSEDGAAAAAATGGQKTNNSSAWGAFEQWGWRSGGVGAAPRRSKSNAVSSEGDNVEVQTGAEGDHVMSHEETVAYLFPSSNVTLAMFYSRFLVRELVRQPINETACQVLKTSLQQARSPPSAANPASGDTPPANGGEKRVGKADYGAGNHTPVEEKMGIDWMEVCYPNRLDIDQPDPVWAAHASALDVLVFGSGRSWREESVEREGLGIFAGGNRQANLSLEGLVGGWAYPQAMRHIAEWLADPRNFKGVAVMRSFSPTHARRDCASHSLRTPKLGSLLADDMARYDSALAMAVTGMPLHILNVSLMTSQRGDGHPWMASPARPKADCSNWCLPGVPDTWNEILATALPLYSHHHH